MSSELNVDFGWVSQPCGQWRVASHRVFSFLPSTIQLNCFPLYESAIFIRHSVPLLTVFRCLLLQRSAIRHFSLSTTAHSPFQYYITHHTIYLPSWPKFFFPFSLPLINYLYIPLSQLLCVPLRACRWCALPTFP